MKSESLAVAFELHDDPTAEEQLKAAIASARENRDKALEGQARAALGIHYAHHEYGDEAFRELSQAVYQLPHGPDREAVEGHLHAVAMGSPCPCKQELAGLAQAVKSYVLERLPEDLVSQFEVDISRTGGVHLDLEVNRDPSPDEAQLVQTTIDEAISIYGRTTSAKAPAEAV